MMSQHISPLQRAFVEAYVQCGDAERSVQMAGYTLGSTAHRAAVLLANPYIQQEIDRYRRILALEPQVKKLYEAMTGQRGG